MAIKAVDELIGIKMPVELLCEDVEEFDKSDLKVVQLVGYESCKPETVRTAMYKVLHEGYDNRIRFFSRKKQFYLEKK